MAQRPPLGHTLVVLSTLIGSFAVLMVYATAHLDPPPGMIALIVAVTTGPATAYLSPRPGPPTTTETTTSATVAGAGPPTQTTGVPAGQEPGAAASATTTTHQE